MKSNQNRTGQSPQSTAGAALAVVMILCMAMLFALAAYISTEMVQKHINARAALQVEARNAAEGVAEFAVAEIGRRASAYSSGPTNPLENYTISDADKNLLVPTDPTSKAQDSLVHTVLSSIDFKNSDLSPRPQKPLLINQADPVYAAVGDPDVGKSLIVRSCNVLATASVKDPVTGNVVSSYISQNIQIREQSWFNYGIFYNMDLEFHAGPDFDVTGPVQTNENLYILEGSGKTLTFSSTVMAVNKIFRRLKWDMTDGGFKGTVYCTNNAGKNVDMALTDESDAAGWKEVAKSKWDDRVKSGKEVQPFAPDGMPTYTPDDFTTPTNELRNRAYLMVEPQLSNQATEGLYGQKDATLPNSPENLKFSALSGFTIRVDPIVGGVATWKLVYYTPNTDTSRPIAKNNLPKRLIGGLPEEITIDPFSNDDNTSVELRHRLRQAIVLVPYSEEGAAGVLGDGTGLLKPYVQQQQKPDPKDPAPDLTNYFALYDRRQGFDYLLKGNNKLKGAFHVLRIDLGKLNDLINPTNPNLWVSPKDGKILYNPSTTWTGIVYVQFPLSDIQLDRFPAVTPDGDMIRHAAAPTETKPGYALVLANAKVLPRILPQDHDKRSDGFTVATNGPAYILGHYNADGDPNTGSATTPDSVQYVPTATSEIPALVAADAVTILSSGWADSDNFNTPANWDKNYFRTSAKTRPDASPFTEISTAIITGIVPTRPNSKDQVWSGGVHNFVRYQENWSNRIYRYRGSLVALFESEVATGPFHQDAHDWYVPPTRQAGYHQFLSEGWFPPGTPVKRTVRRMNLSDIYKPEYDAGPTVPDPST